MTDTGTVVPTALSRWFEAFRADVLAGRVELAELLEVADYDMQQETPELCPICTRSMVPGDDGYQHGTCAICWLQHLREAHERKIMELEALKAYNVSKKQVQRLRDEIAPDRPRGTHRAADYGLASMYPTDDPLFIACDVCGMPFHKRGSDTCPACLEQRDRRRRKWRACAD